MTAIDTPASINNIKNKNNDKITFQLWFGSNADLCSSAC